MQKWFDKAAVAAVALILSMGALFAGPRRLLAIQDRRRRMEDNQKVMSRAKRACGYDAATTRRRCGTCGAANIAGAGFCSACAASKPARWSHLCSPAAPRRKEGFCRAVL